MPLEWIRRQLPKWGLRLLAIKTARTFLRLYATGEDTHIAFQAIAVPRWISTNAQDPSFPSQSIWDDGDEEATQDGISGTHLFPTSPMPVYRVAEDTIG